LNERSLSSAIPGSAQSSGNAGAGLTAVGAIASFGAILAAASCCVLPLALAGLGVGAGLSSSLAALMPLRWPLTALSIVGLAAGWWTYVRRRRVCAADRSCTVSLPGKATLVALTVGTVVTIATVLWDKLEAPLIRALS